MSSSPRPLADLLPALIAPSLARPRSAASRLAADWPLIVGARLAAITHPCKLAAQTLTLACDGPTALELQHGANPLIDRVNRHLGKNQVTRLRLVQRPLPARPGLPCLGPPPTLPGPPPDPPADFAPGPVRDALVRLAAALTREGSG